MLNKLVFLGLFMAGGAVCGQGFITPVDEVPHANECYIVKTDGARIEARVKSYDMGEGIKAITVTDPTGAILRIPAAEILELGVKVTGLVKMELMAESTETVKKLTRADFKEIGNREHIIYQQALMPGKKEKYVLLQLLNPGFDSRIKVFQDPWARETNGVTFGAASLTGEEDRSYLYVRDNTRAFKVKKGSYKKDFADIYGDCSKMAAFYQGEKVRFRDAAQHVWVYDQACNQ